MRKTIFPKMDFLDREKELEAVRRSKGFVLIYGRRRIGKTKLAKEALPNALYISGFSDTLEDIADKLGVEASRTSVILKSKEIIIDEFQAFEGIEKSLAYAYDLLGENVRVVLITSYFSFAKSILSEGSPLYGRISRRILLKQLPRKAVVDKFGLDFYLLFGGTPQYVERGKEHGIEGLIDETSALFNEPEFLFNYEFKSQSYREAFKRASIRPRPLPKSLVYYAEKMEEMDLMRSVWRGKGRLRELSDNYFRTRMSLREVRRIADYEERKKAFYKILPQILDANFEAMFRDINVRRKRNPTRILYPYGLDVEIDAIIETEDERYIVEVKRRKAKEEDCVELLKKIPRISKFLKKRYEPIIVALEGKTSCETLTLDDFRRENM